MPEVELTIPKETREFLSGEIRAARGNEVYFLAQVEWESDTKASVAEAQVFARGHRGAAPAIVEGAEKWDIALHNHPSGRLDPSDADVNVAGELGNKCVGFAIIDNAAERIYVVVPPFVARRRPTRVDPDAVRAVFAEGGALHRALGDYEPRAAQVEMALQVCASLNEDRIVAVEAGTGVGKSFAYLVPSILWAVANSKRVIVSTNTINLQEQLVRKDLPFLRGALGVEFKHALIKGRGNYVCRRKAGEVERELASNMIDDDEAKALKNLLEWIKTAKEGSRSELGVPPPENTWEKVMSESDRSLKTHCPHYQECFFYSARAQASNADILVVNHHLFFSDLAVRKATGNFDREFVIPGYGRVVFDEAHHLEDVASEHLGVRISQRGVEQRLGRLVSRRDAKKGTLPYLAQALRQEGAVVAAERLEKDLLPEVTVGRDRIEAAFQTMLGAAQEAMESQPQGSGGRAGAAVNDSVAQESRIRLSGRPGEKALLQALQDEFAIVRDAVGLIASRANRVFGALEDEGSISEDRRRSLGVELSSLRSRMSSLVDQVNTFLDFEDRALVRWIEVRTRPREPNRREVSFNAAPVRVAEDLKTHVFTPVKSVVLTSATLSVEGKLDYVSSRLGLGGVSPDRFTFREFPSPYDFARQVMTLVPADLPEPDAPGFEAAMVPFLLDVLKRTRGRAFVLFTAYGQLRRVHAALEGPLALEGIRALRQGERGRSELLDLFRSGPPHVLFGTDSFWEGVDVKGEALSCVVITRLPFRVPTEPIQVARAEEIEARGESAFRGLTIPQAVLKFKQGFGRLVRSSTDRGAVAVLDRRIVSKPYGRSFLRSLPPTRFVQASGRELLRHLEAFFKTQSASRALDVVPEDRAPAGAPTHGS